MTLDTSTIKAISSLGRQFSDVTIMMHEAIAKNAGLSGTDHKYLGLLLNNGAMTAGELSKLTGLTTGAVTGLVDRLERVDLVRRAFDKGDRRKVMIVPNAEKSKKLLGSIFEALQSKMTDYFSTLTKQETTIIEQYLVSTIAIMQDFTTNLQNSNSKP